jgi:ketosteroid isomerase-like protein
MAFTGPIHDRIAIRELMDTHAHGVMTRDAAAWGEIWADDASWSLPDYPDLGVFEGKAAIVAAWSASMERYGLENCTKPMLYFMQPGSIEVEGDSASAVAYTIEVYDDPDSGKRIHTTGRYNDELRKIDGQWRFTKRAYRTVFAE